MNPPLMSAGEPIQVDTIPPSEMKVSGLYGLFFSFKNGDNVNVSL